jgi:hypothetical protein
MGYLQSYGSCWNVSHAAELAIGNIVRRVLHMIREEEQQEQLEQSEGSSTPGDGGKGLQVGTYTALRYVCSTAAVAGLELVATACLSMCSSRAVAAQDCSCLSMYTFCCECVARVMVSSGTRQHPRLRAA